MKKWDLSSIPQGVFFALRILLRILSVFILIFTLAYISFIVYSYTGPHSLPSLAHFLEKHSKDYFPENTDLKIASIDLNFDNTRFATVTSLKGVAFRDPDFGTLTLDEVQIFFDLFGLIHGSGRTFLNFKILSPSIDLKTGKQEAHIKIDLGALPKWGALLHKYRYKVQSLNISLVETPFEVELLGKSHRIQIENLAIRPMLVQDELVLSMSGKIQVEDISQHLDLKIGVDSKNTINMDAKTEFSSEGNLKGQVDLHFSTDGTLSKGTFLADNISLNLIKTYWPNSVKEKTRDEIISHISDGIIGSAEGSFESSGKNIEIHSKLSQLLIKNIYKNCNLTQGNAILDLSKNILKIEAEGKINDQTVFILARKQSLLKDEAYTHIKSKIDWKDLSKLGVGVPSFLSKTFSIEMYMQEKKRSHKIILELDLTETKLEKTLGISKQVGEPGKIGLNIESDGQTPPIFHYVIKLGKHESMGVGSLDKDFRKIAEIKSSSIKIMGPEKSLAEIELSYKSDKIVLKTKDLGTALKALAVTDKIKKGELQFNGTLSQDHIKGDLNIEHLEVEKIPFFVKVLSLGALSIVRFKSILGTLQGKAIEFSKLTASFVYSYRDMTLQIKKLKASGKILRGSAKGEINFKDKPIGTISGIIAPSNVLNVTVKQIPIAEKKDAGPPIAIQFKLLGRLENPDVSVDLLRNLTPDLLP